MSPRTATGAACCGRRRDGDLRSLTQPGSVDSTVGGRTGRRAAIWSLLHASKKRRLYVTARPASSRSVRALLPRRPVTSSLSPEPVGWLADWPVGRSAAATRNDQYTIIRARRGFGKPNPAGFRGRRTFVAFVGTGNGVFASVACAVTWSPNDVTACCKGPVDVSADR